MRAWRACGACVRALRAVRVCVCVCVCVMCVSGGGGGERTKRNWYFKKGGVGNMVLVSLFFIQ